MSPDAIGKNRGWAQNACIEPDEMTTQKIDFRYNLDRVTNPLKWSDGKAVVAADYSIGRDLDATNQLHLNVPTGATFELSVNDTPEFVFSATQLDLKNNNIVNLGTLNTHTIPGGTDTFVLLAAAQTLAAKTLTTPTIAATGWANATHAHAGANSGGQVGAGDLSGAALAAGVTASSLTSFGASPTLTTPAIAATGWANATHAHAAANSGGAVVAASDTVAGVLEVATIAETNTGTDATRAVSPDGLAGSVMGEVVVQMVVFDFGTDVAVGDGKFYLHIDNKLAGMDLVRVHAEVITAGVTGTMDIQIANVDALVDMLSTKLTIDSAETGSDTALTPAVINTLNDDVQLNEMLRVDVDAVQTTKAKGLIVTLVFRLP